MRKIIFTIAITFLILGLSSFSMSRSKSEQEHKIRIGKELLNQKGCFACHKETVKLVGPSYQEIAKVYKESNGDMKLFLKGQSKAIVDPKMASLMTSQTAITKDMSEADLNAIILYIQSIK